MRTRLPAADEAPESTEALAPFRIDAPLAVRDCLRALRDRCAPLALHGLPGNGRWLEARLVSVNAPIDRIELDIGVTGFNVVVPPARSIQVVGFLDRVKVQFELAELERIEAAQGLRLRAWLPAVLYRRQRRDAYRVRPFGSSAARCTVPDTSALPAGTFDVQDASVGGVSLRWDAQCAPDHGALLEDCILALPEVAPFRCDLRVRSVEPGDAGKARFWRIGCAFETLSAPLQRAMQRFVFDTDRRTLRQRRAAAPSQPHQ